MKRLILLFFVVVSSVHAQNKTTQNASTDILAKMPAAHPRLLMLKGEEAGILKQIKKHKEWSNIHEDILFV